VKNISEEKERQVPNAFLRLILGEVFIAVCGESGSSSVYLLVFLWVFCWRGVKVGGSVSECRHSPL